MKREILFRALGKDGKWHFGYLSYAEQEDKYYIGVQELMAPVIPETVGQFTGLLDKNGNKIFEGDLVDIHFPKKSIIQAEIQFENCALVMAMDEYSNRDFVLAEQECHGLGMELFELLEIVGNIHDTPLIK